jgi:hypothetical protein
MAVAHLPQRQFQNCRAGAWEEITWTNTKSPRCCVMSLILLFRIPNDATRSCVCRVADVVEVQQVFVLQQQQQKQQPVLVWRHLYYFLPRASQQITMERPVSVAVERVSSTINSSVCSAAMMTEDSSSPTANGTPKSRVMSKVLKKLKNGSQKWRKRRSRTASQALSDSSGSVVHSTFSFSESGSVTSSMLEGSLTIEEEEEHVGPQTKEEKNESVSKQASAEDSNKSTAAAITVYEESTSTITVTSTESLCIATTTTTTKSVVALRGDLDDWCKFCRDLFAPLCVGIEQGTDPSLFLSYSQDGSCVVDI